MDSRSALAGFKEYLKLERGYSAHTVSNYLSDLRGFFDQLQRIDPQKAPEGIDTEDLRGFIHELQDMGVSVATQARKLSSLKAFFRYLLQEELIESDPSSLIEMPKAERKFPDVLSPKEIQDVLDGIDPERKNGLRDRAIIEVLYGCGLRVSELIDLRISELHFEEAYVRVKGKGDKERLVPLGKLTARAVKDYLDQDRLHRKAASRHEDLLFLNRSGKGMSRVMIFHIVRDTAFDAGIRKKVSPHTYRHSFATHLVEGGADLMAVKEMLGHVSVSTTEIYSHLDRHYLREELIHHHPRGRS